MSPNREPRRSLRTLLRALVADPYRKLAAIGLAGALYYYLDNQVNQKHVFTLTLVTMDQAQAAPASVRRDFLQIDVPVGQWTAQGYRDVGTDTRIDQVQLTVRGPKRALERVIARSSFTVPFDDIDFALPLPGLDFTVADVRSEADLQDLELSLDPPRVHIDLERNAARAVVLSQSSLDQVELAWQSQSEQERLQGRLREDSAEFSQQTLTLRGPKAELDQLLRARKPFRAVLHSKSSDDLQVEGLLELNRDASPAPHVTIEGGATVVIDVRPKPTTLTLDLPLVVDDLALPLPLRGRYWPDPDKYRRPDVEPIPGRPDLTLSTTAEVNVSGPLANMLTSFDDDKKQAQWARQHFRLRLFLQPLAPDAAEQTPQEEVLVQAQLDLEGALYDPSYYSLKLALPVFLKLHDR